MTEPLHILVTGTSRGIGEAILAALRRPSRRRPFAPRAAAGGSRPTSSRARAPPRGCGTRRWSGSTGGSTCSSTMPACSRRRRSTRRRDWTARWERTLRINLTAAAELCRLAVLHFRERGAGGRIVNVASRAAYRGDSPDHWHYAASKAGMVGDDQDDRARLCRRGHLRLRGLPRASPSPAWSRSISKAAAASPRSATSRSAGRRRTGEVAETVRWLAVDAPASATGAVIDVNGASFVR